MYLYALIRYPLSKPCASTHTNNQPLRCPCGSHIKDSCCLLLILFRSRHMLHIWQRHYRKLQAFADLHGHHLDGVASGVKVAGAAVHFYEPRQGLITHHPSPPTTPHAVPAAHALQAKLYAAFAPAPPWVAARSSIRRR